MEPSAHFDVVGGLQRKVLMDGNVNKQLVGLIVHDIPHYSQWNRPVETNAPFVSRVAEVPAIRSRTASNSAHETTVGSFPSYNVPFQTNLPA